MNETLETGETGGGKSQTVFLEKALRLFRYYGEATGATVCITDHKFTPLPEVIPLLNAGQNICLYCTRRYLERTQPERVRNGEMPDPLASPCAAFHTHAMKEAHRFRGSYIYMCDLGIMFWTTPLFWNGRFAGAAIASGCLGVDREETVQAMAVMGRDAIPLEEIRGLLSTYEPCDEERVEALTELLLMCAQSLSGGDGGYHETLRRRAEQQTRLAEELALLKAKYPENSAAPSYFPDKERLLLEAIRRGDPEAARKALDELLAALVFANSGQFKRLRYRAMELMVVLSRSAVTAGGAGNVMIETSKDNSRLVQEARDTEELTDALHIIVEAMAGQIFSFQGFRHAAVLRKAERFIRENYTRKLSLKEIADKAGLSAPYFSTIFKEEMGENLSAYLNRLRVDKAGRLLLETDMTLSEIASSCGFEDQSWFSKIFKGFIGVSPGKFRKRGGKDNM